MLIKLYFSLINIWIFASIDVHPKYYAQYLMILTCSISNALLWKNIFKNGKQIKENISHFPRRSMYSISCKHGKTDFTTENGNNRIPNDIYIYILSGLKCRCSDPYGSYMHNMLNSGRVKWGQMCWHSFFSSLLILLVLILLLFTVCVSQIKEERLVLLCQLSLSLWLSFIVQKEVRRVVSTAVGHHHCADSAGIDVLDLKQTLHHIHVFWLNVLNMERGNKKWIIKEKIYI